MWNKRNFHHTPLRGEVKVVNDSRTELLQAAARGDTETVKWLLTNGSRLLEKDNDGATALLCAAAKGHIETVEWLFVQGAMLLEKDYAGCTALLLAAQAGETNTVEWLLSHGATLLEKDIKGGTALLKAAEGGHTKTVECLLAHEASLLEKDIMGNTALLKAAEGGHTETVEWLLAHGASLLEKDSRDNTALLKAVSKMGTGVVKVLLAHGVVGVEKNKWGSYPLIEAVTGGHKEIVRLLLEYRAGGTQRDTGIALIEAVSRGDKEIMELLLLHGVSLAEKNIKGESALVKAVSQGHADMVKVLLTYGASLTGETHAAYLKCLRSDLSCKELKVVRAKLWESVGAYLAKGYLSGRYATQDVRAWSQTKVFFKELKESRKAFGAQFKKVEAESLGKRSVLSHAFLAQDVLRLVKKSPALPLLASAPVHATQIEVTEELQSLLSYLSFPLPKDGCRFQLWVPGLGWRGLKKECAMRVGAPKNNLEGRSRVNTCGEVHFKFSPMKPGLEFAVDRLARLLLGAGHISATTLFILREIKDYDTVKTEWGIASQTVTGINEVGESITGYSVRDTLKQQALDTFRIDPDSFTAQFLITLLTLPFDGHPNNYFVVPRPGYEERGVWLMGIDNDLSFYPPWVQRLDGAHVPYVRSFLLMLPQMHRPLSSDIRELFLRQAPRLAMVEWLSQLDHLSQFYAAHAELFEGALGPRRFLPVHFAEGILEGMLDSWERLYVLLQCEEVLTHHEMLSYLAPEVATYYAGIRAGIQTHYWVPYWERCLAQKCIPAEEIVETCARLTELDMAMNVVLDSAESERAGSLEFLQQEQLVQVVPSSQRVRSHDELQWKEWEQQVLHQGVIQCSVEGALQRVCALFDIEAFSSPVQARFFEQFEALGERLQRIGFAQVTTDGVGEALLTLLKNQPHLIVEIGNIRLNPIAPAHAWAYCLHALQNSQQHLWHLLKQQGYLEEAVACLKTTGSDDGQGSITEKEVKTLLSAFLQEKENQGATPFEYQRAYGELAPQWRSLFLTLLCSQPVLVALLSVYPEKNGERVGFLVHDDQWRVGLHTLFADAPGPLSCRYLLGRGELRTGYVDLAQRHALQKQGILTSKDQFNFSQPAVTELSGNHLVFPFAGPGLHVHVKVAPEFPAMELAMMLLARRCVGLGVTPHVTVGRWQSAQTFTPVLLSETIEGLPTDEWPLIWQHLNAKAFSRLFVLTLLTNPEDQKPDNLIATPMREGGETTYALVSIDNDRAFVSPFEGTHLLVKTMVYCCDEMHAPLHPEVCEEILVLSPYHLLAAWMDELEQANEGLTKLFSEEVLKKSFEAKEANQRSYLGGLLKQGALVELFKTLQRLQCLLRKKPNISLFDVLGKIKGSLAQHYRRAHAAASHPLNRFEWATHNEYHVKRVGQAVYYTSTLRMQDYLKSMHGQEVKGTDLQTHWQHNLKQAKQDLLTLAMETHQLENARLLLEHGHAALFHNLPTDYAREQVLHRIDFRELLDEANQSYVTRQRAILSSAIGTSFLELRLKQVRGLDNQLLAALVQQSPHLKILDVSGCIALTAIPTLETYTPLLEQLNLSQTGITVLKFNAPLHHLLELQAEECKTLVEVNIEAPRLAVVRLNGHQELKRLHLITPALTRLDFQGYSWLEQVCVQSTHFAWMQAAWEWAQYSVEYLQPSTWDGEYSLEHILAAASNFGLGPMKEAMRGFLFHLLVQAINNLWEAQGPLRTFPPQALVRFFQLKRSLPECLPRWLEIGIQALLKWSKIRSPGGLARLKETERERKERLSLPQHVETPALRVLPHLAFYLLPVDSQLLPFVRRFLDQRSDKEARRVLWDLSDMPESKETWEKLLRTLFEALLGKDLLGEDKAESITAARVFVRLSRRSSQLKEIFDEDPLWTTLLKNAFMAEELALPQQDVTPAWLVTQFYDLQSDDLRVYETAAWALELHRETFYNTLLKQHSTVAERWAWLFPSLAHAVKQLYQRHSGAVDQGITQDPRVVLLDVDNTLVNSKGQLNRALIWALQAHGIKQVILMTSYSLSWNLKRSLEKNILRCDIIRRLKRYGLEVIAVQVSGAPYYADKTLGIYYQTVVEPIEREARALADAGCSIQKVMTRLQERHQLVMDEELRCIEEGIKTEDPATKGGKQHLLKQVMGALPDERHVFFFDDKYEVIQYAQRYRNCEELKKRALQLTSHEVFFGHELESPCVYEKTFQGPEATDSPVSAWLSAKEGLIAWVRLQWIAEVIAGEWVLDQGRIRHLKMYQQVVVVDQNEKALEAVTKVLLKHSWKVETLVASKEASRDFFANWMLKQAHQQGLKGVQVHVYEISERLRVALRRDYETDGGTMVMDLALPVQKAMQRALIDYEQDRWRWLHIMFQETPFHTYIQKTCAAFAALTPDMQFSLLFVLHVFRSAALTPQQEILQRAESALEESKKKYPSTKFRLFEGKEQQQVHGVQESLEGLLQIVKREESPNITWNP